jgi:hypothetical protein
MFDTTNTFIWLYECQLCKKVSHSHFPENHYQGFNPPDRITCHHCGTPYMKRIRRMEEKEHWEA